MESYYLDRKSAALLPLPFLLVEIIFSVEFSKAVITCNDICYSISAVVMQTLYFNAWYLPLL